MHFRKKNSPSISKINAGEKNLNYIKYYIGLDELLQQSQNNKLSGAMIRKCAVVLGILLKQENNFEKGITISYLTMASLLGISLRNGESESAYYKRIQNYFSKPIKILKDAGLIYRETSYRQQYLKNNWGNAIAPEYKKGANLGKIERMPHFRINLDNVTDIAAAIVREYLNYRGICSCVNLSRIRNDLSYKSNDTFYKDVNKAIIDCPKWTYYKDPQGRRITLIKTNTFTDSNHTQNVGGGTQNVGSNHAQNVGVKKYYYKK